MVVQAQSRLWSAPASEVEIEGPPILQQTAPQRGMLREHPTRSRNRDVTLAVGPAGMDRLMLPNWAPDHRLGSMRPNFILRPTVAAREPEQVKRLWPIQNDQIDLYRPRLPQTTVGPRSSIPPATKLPAISAGVQNPALRASGRLPDRRNIGSTAASLPPRRRSTSLNMVTCLRESRSTSHSYGSPRHHCMDGSVKPKSKQNALTQRALQGEPCSFGVQLVSKAITNSWLQSRLQVTTSRSASSTSVGADGSIGMASATPNI